MNQNEQNVTDTPDATNQTEVLVESLGVKVSITEDSEGNILDISPISAQ